MARITQSNATPAFIPAPLIGPVCVVFEETTVQVAQASLPATAITFTAIGDDVARLIQAQLPDGVVPGADTLSSLTRDVLAGLISSGNVLVDACVPAGAEPTLATQLLPDQIIYCGSVDAIVTARTIAAWSGDLIVAGTPPIAIKVTVPSGTIGSSMVTLSLQGEQPAPGVLPSDSTLARVVTAEMATTCLAGGTTVGTTGGLITTTLVSIRAAHVVSTQVFRVLNPSPPSIVEAALDAPEVPPSAAARNRRQRTIVWSLSVDDKRTE